MFTKRILRVILIATITLLVVNINPGSAEKLGFQPLPAPASDPVGMGTAFTYQGRLTSGSSPANGVYDFEFKLYDDAVATPPLPIGTVYLDDYTVTNGLFMANLDYGPGVFTGFERWLQIGVRAGTSTGSYTILSPRQQINPAPYATFAGTIYRKTVVVKPVTPAGSETDNGKELLIAMASITDASSTNPYLLKIEPGIYDLFEDSLVMKPYVDVEGSGEGVTIIRANGNNDGNSGTIVCASHVEIRSLTIEADGYPNGGPWYDEAIGVYIPDVVEMKMMHVTVKAKDSTYFTTGIFIHGGYDTGGGFYLPAVVNLDTVDVFASFDDALTYEYNEVNGIYIEAGSTLTLTNSEILAGGAENATGIYNDRSHTYIYDSSIVVKGDGFAEYVGIYNRGYSDPTMYPTLYMRNSSIAALADNGYTDSILNGIRNYNNGLTQLFDSTIVAAGSRTSATGIDTSHGSGDSSGLFAMTNVKVEVYGSNIANIGIRNQDAPVVIRDSHVYAHDGALAIGMEFYRGYLDTGAPDHTITQTEIMVEAATPSGSVDPLLNTNIGIKISSAGLFKMIRDSILVPDQTPLTSPVGGIGILNESANVVFENGTINTTTQAAFKGIVDYYDSSNGPSGNSLFVNNSEIYTCIDDALCNTVLVLQGAGYPPESNILSIGSTLLWGGPVSFPAAWSFGAQCALIHDEAWAVTLGPACP